MADADQIVYAVNEDAPSTDGLCALDDGRVLVSQFGNLRTALDATAADPSLRLVRHEDLSRRERKRVEKALRQSHSPKRSE